MHFSYPISATRSAHLNLLDLVVLIMLYNPEQYEPRSSSLPNFLQPLVTSYRLRSKQKVTKWI